MTASAASEIYVGLMSGTSLDGVDVAIVDFSSFPPRLLHSATTAYEAQVRESLQQLCQQQTIPLDGLYNLHAQLGEIYAETVIQALADEGLERDRVAAIGCHGQTIRHGPDATFPYTAQIGDANRIAVRTSIDTVADFRGKDIALGGQAAPLAPAFHRFLFRSDDENRAVINIGGIANITCLPANADEKVLGFDTGPGNTLMDIWCQQHRGRPYDASGDWARQGVVDDSLLRKMISSEPYFSLPPPKSTGTEYFNPDWLRRQIGNTPDPANVQATLAELTAVTIADAIEALPIDVSSCFVCGGGAHNQYLLERLQRKLGERRLETTEALGLDPDFVEACAFAWLARERVKLRPGNLPEVTRAGKPAVLGAIYAADKD